MMLETWKKLFERKEELVLEPLRYGLDDLDPVLSEECMKFHYKILARTYVDRYNTKGGDPAFDEAGAFLHNVFFSQFRAPSRMGPKDNMLSFIEDHFKSYENLQAEVEKEALALQGSGWVYLSKNGEIKTIENHAIRKDIVFLIDMWEHSWYLDYGPDKKRYLKNIWRIVDWDKLTLKIT